MEHLTLKEILGAVVALLVALLGGLTIKNKMKKNSVVQKNNTVGGNIAGRDINNK